MKNTRMTFFSRGLSAKSSGQPVLQDFSGSGFHIEEAARDALNT